MPVWMFPFVHRDRVAGAGARVNGAQIAKRRAANKRARKARKACR